MSKVKMEDLGKIFAKPKHIYVTLREIILALNDCMRKKKNTASAAKFEMDRHYNIMVLYYAINNLMYSVGPSITFLITYPVMREVFAASFADRVVHHLIMRELEESFESVFINNTFSCRKGKGTLYGIEQMKKDLKEATDSTKEDVYIIKCDLKSFFMSIDKRKLLVKLNEMIDERYSGDKEFLKDLVRRVVMDCPQKHCVRKQHKSMWDKLPLDKSLFNNDEYTGLPIGNLTSQWFANGYLDKFDHWVTRDLGFKRYGRYVDDFYIIATKSELKEKGFTAGSLVEVIREWLKEEGVTLHPKKVSIQKANKGMVFIGAMVKPYGSYISNRTKAKFYENIYHFNKYLKDTKEKLGREPNEEEVMRVVKVMNSYLGLMKHHLTYNIRKRGIQEMLLPQWKEYIWVEGNYSKIGINRRKFPKKNVLERLVGKKRRNRPKRVKGKRMCTIKNNKAKVKSVQNAAVVFNASATKDKVGEAVLCN